MNITDLIHWLEGYASKFLVSFVLTFASFVAIGGVQVDLTTTTGRAVAVSALLHALYSAFEKATTSTTSAPTTTV